MKLLENILHKLLTEGRIEDAKLKYPEVDKRGYVSWFSKKDPSGNNKYLMWMVGEYNEGLSDEAEYRDPYDIANLVANFDKQKAKLAKKDLYQYENPIDVVNAIKTIGSKKYETLKGADKIWENEDWVLMYVKNQDSVCHYGSNTDWCITARGQSHYQDYLNEGILFYFLINKHGTADEERLNKIAIALPYDSYDIGMSADIYDTTDNSITLDDLNDDYLRDVVLAAIEKDARTRERPEPDFTKIYETLNDAVANFNKVNENSVLYASVDDTDPWEWGSEHPIFRVNVGGSFEMTKEVHTLIGGGKKHDAAGDRKVSNFLQDIIDDIASFSLSEFYVHNDYSAEGSPKILNVSFDVELQELIDTDPDIIIRALDYDLSDIELTQKKIDKAIEWNLLDADLIDIGEEELSEIKGLEVETIGGDGDDNMVLVRFTLMDMTDKPPTGIWVRGQDLAYVVQKAQKASANQMSLPGMESPIADAFDPEAVRKHLKVVSPSHVLDENPAIKLEVTTRSDHKEFEEVKKFLVALSDNTEKIRSWFKKLHRPAKA